MSQYGNITSVDESPLVEELLYVGTDGLIQVSEDGGKNCGKPSGSLMCLTLSL